MAELTFSSPIFTQSAEEMAAERAILNRDGIYDPNFEMLTSDARERFLSGAVQSSMGSAIYQTVEGAYDWFSGETKDPLNFSSINEVGPGSPVTYAMGNNKEGLQKDLDTIPAKHWQYVLSASSYNEYQDRLEFVRRGMPQAQASTIGLATGLVADIGVMALGGYLAEPIALAGLGTRTTMAGKVASRSFGSYGAQPVAAAAAEAANAVSRLSLGARYTAVGVGEEVVYQFARQGIDPLYDPSFGEVVQNMVLSGSAAGLIGGVAFGRRFVADQIEEAAQGFYRQGQAILPGGFEINYTPFAFQSAAYADQALASAGGRTADEALQESAEAGLKEWNELPQELPTSSEVVGTRFDAGSITPTDQGVTETAQKAVGEAVPEGKPLEQISTPEQRNRSFMVIRVLVSKNDPRFETAPAVRMEGTFNNPNLDRPVTQTSLAELNLRGDRVYHETSSKNFPALLQRLEGGQRRHEGLFVSDNIDLALGQGGRGVVLELDPSLVNGNPNKAKVLEGAIGREFIVDRSLVGNVRAVVFADEKTANKFREQLAPVFDVDRPTTTERGIRFERRADAKTAKVAPAAQESQPLKPIANTDAAKPVVTPKPSVVDVPKPVTRPVQSSSMFTGAQRAAFEVSLATGVQPTVETFKAIGRAMVTAARTSRGGGFAFNKRFWEALSDELGEEVASKFRPLQQRSVINGADKRFDSLYEREFLVDDVWSLFNTGRWRSVQDAPNSLVFRVLDEIRSRGGTVTRQVVNEVVNDLRELAKNPPTRTNAKGRVVVDTYGRKAAVIEIINKRTGAVDVGSASTVARRKGRTTKPIDLPESVLKRLSATATSKTVRATAVAGGPDTGGSPPTITSTPGTFDGMPKQLSTWFTERIPLISPLLNQAARAMESENGAVRLIASMAFNARRATGSATKYTIFEAGSQILHSTMFTFMRGYRNSFVRFAMGRGTEDIAEDAGTLLDNWKYAFGNKDLRLQFNRRIMKQMRSGNFDDTVSAVNDAARGFKEIFEKVHNIAFEAGVAGFTKSAVVNYVPRLWRFDMIRRLATTSEGTEALTGLIEQAIAKNGRKVVIDGVEETFTGDVKAAAKVFTERLISIAKSTENAPMTEQDQELVEALGDLLGPLKAKTGSRTPFGRSRILLDESAEITTTGDLLGNGRNNLSLADLFDDDLPKVFKKYITSVMGAVNERRLINGFNDYLAANGFKGPKKVVDGVEVQEPLKVSTINEMLDTARKLGGAIEDGHLEGLKEVIAALRYEPIYSGAPKFGDKAMSLFMQYGYLTTGGQFGLAAINEISRLVGTFGVRRTFTQLPVLAEMIANYKNLDRPAQNFASLLDSWFSPSTDRLRRTFMDPLGSTEYTGPFQNAMRGATNLMSDISGLAPINSFTQQLTAATTLQHLFEFGSGAIKKGLDVGAIRSLGLEPDEYKKLAEWVASNAELKDGFLGKRVVGLKNMDAVEMDQLKKFVDRMVRTRIQDVPTRGDFHKMAFTWWGRLVTQFSTFNLKGIDNFLIQNAGRVKQGGGLQVAKEITATAMLAALIGYGRNYADWWSFKQARNYEEAKKREELLTLEGVVRGSFSGPSEMYLLTKGADAMWGLVDKDPLFAPYRYSGLSAFGFPGETSIRNAVGVINDAKGALIGKPLGLDIERQITSKTVHMGRMLLPLQNMPGIKQYLNILEEEISDEYNLNRRQPRSSD